VPDLPAGCSGLILAIGGASLVSAVGAIAAWQATDNPAWVYEFLKVPAALLMVWLSAVECWLAAAARLQFAPGELMRRVWTWISLSAAADFAGSLGVQIFGANSRLNLLTWAPAGRATLVREINTLGHLLGGPIRFALLAAGVWYAIVAYRRARFLGRLRITDRVLLGLFALYLARNVVDVVRAVHGGKVVSWAEAANWPTDPLLGVLFALAMTLYRSVSEMGDGWIGRCWRALSIGVFLTAVADVGAWAVAYGYLPYVASIVLWFFWLPAAICFALAPAYQLEAIANARAGRMSEVTR
jgi:hypothetical protein